MNPNDLDIHLLRTDPGRLIVRYQPLVRLVVGQFITRGCGQRSEYDDLVQEVNRKLIERMPRIRQLYNQKSLFRTYFSVVIRNIFLEEIRKTRLVAEPLPQQYEHPAAHGSHESLVILQEVQRFERAMILFGSEGPLLNLCLRCLLDMGVRHEDLSCFQTDPGFDVRELMLTELNAMGEKKRGDKLNRIGSMLPQLGEKVKSGDNLRKWYGSRLQELLDLMNGQPPKASYTLETIQILMEKSEAQKKDG